MSKNKLGKILLGIVAMFAAITALAHAACIVIGESCYRAQLAPAPIIQSAVNGTWLAPVGTAVVSSLFMMCALYALSAAKLIIRLPFLNAAIYTIATLCVVRGLATIPLLFLYPHLVGTFDLVAGCVWFFSGLLFLSGFKMVSV